MPAMGAPADWVARRRGEDPIRHVPRQKWRIKVEKKTSVPGYPQRFSPGTHDVVVYEDQVKHLLAKVEDNWTLVEQARQLYKQRLDEFVHAFVSPDHREYDDLRRQRERDFRQTPESIYFELTNGTTDANGIKRLGIRPISSAEKLEDLPPPEDERSTWVRDVVKSMGSAGQGGGDYNALLQMLEQQQEKIDALESELNRRKGGRPPKDRSGDE